LPHYSDGKVRAFKGRPQRIVMADGRYTAKKISDATPQETIC
jgi:hypothetical protein